MSATNILLALLITLFTILLLRWSRTLKPQLAGFQSQMMCRLAAWSRPDQRRVAWSVASRFPWSIRLL